VPISDGVDFGQVIVKHTYMGDANLDGKVDDRDYLNVCPTWVGGATFITAT